MSSQKRNSASKTMDAKETPDHSEELNRLSRIRGQVDGIERMIREGRYCPDIMNQVRSATSALRSVEKQLLKRHLKHCVTQAIRGKNPKEGDQKIQELMDLFDR